MLIQLTNQPRNYSWGSTTLLAELEGREPSGLPEAEVWFRDHPGDPSDTPDGQSLDLWIAEEGRKFGIEDHLPYLLKVLAAGSALSIQAHPSKAQAIAGFAREEAEGTARDSSTRTYRDDNHKPELIVALSPTFRALAGLRKLDRTRHLVAQLGDSATALAGRLASEDSSLADVIGWLLSDGAGSAQMVVDAAVATHSDEFADEFDLARTLNEQFPGDPGIVVALLMNLVTLRQGQGLFVPAGVLHAYLDGLGVELMAASDNVLRGGLTPKHIDAAELVSVLDPTPGDPPILHPRVERPGVRSYDVPIDDFALRTVTVEAENAVTLQLTGPTIVLATAGRVTVVGRSGGPVTLSPGQAAFVAPVSPDLTFTGDGTAFVATPGDSSRG